MTPLESTPFSEIRMRSIEWLEKPLWQRSAFQLLRGPKGAGKGTYLAGLAARISNSGQNVLFVSQRGLGRDRHQAATRRGRARLGPLLHHRRQHVRLPDDVADAPRPRAQPSAASACSSIDPVANHIGATQLEQRSRSTRRDRAAQRTRRRPRLPPHRRPPSRQGPNAAAPSRASSARPPGSTQPRAVVMIAVDDEDPTSATSRSSPATDHATAAPKRSAIEAVDVAGTRPSRSPSPSSSASPASPSTTSSAEPTPNQHNASTPKPCSRPSSTPSLPARSPANTSTRFAPMSSARPRTPSTSVA